MNKVVESFRSLMVEEQEVSQQTGSKTVKTKTAPVRQSASASNVVRLVFYVLNSRPWSGLFCLNIFI